ncbi:MAG: TonB-dependent receptor family protein [Steroidobacteraceae bacterium]
MRPAVCCAALATLALAVASTASRAQGSNPSLEEVFVTGILPESLESVPGSYVVIDASDLGLRPSFSIREALALAPGVHSVGEDSLGLGLNIGVRGMDPRRTSRTLLLEDGMPLFLAPYGDPSAHYSTSLERIQRIEVVKGSGQVLHGPQTVGGMINFVTRPVIHDGREGSLALTMGNNGFQAIHAGLGAGNDRMGFRLDLLQKRGDGIREHHEFEVGEYVLKAAFSPAPGHRLDAKLGHFMERSRVSETGLGTLEYRDNPLQAPSGKNDRFLQDRSTLQVRHHYQPSARLSWSSQLYGVINDRASFRQIDTPGGYDDDEPGLSTGYSLIDRCGTAATLANAESCGGRWRPREYAYWGAESRLSIHHRALGVDQLAILGARFHHEDIRRNQYRSPAAQAQSLAWAREFGEHREDVRIETRALSAFLQNRLEFGHWSLTPGLRIERYRIQTDVVRADSTRQDNPESARDARQTVLLPGLGLAWQGSPGLSAFAGIHRGFAPPRPDRDIRANGADSAVVDDTRAEKSTQYELGLRWRHAEWLSAEATLFRTDFDQIVIQDGAGTFVNGGASRMGGLELAGRVECSCGSTRGDSWSLQGAYTHLADAEFRRDGLQAASGIVKGARLPYAPRQWLTLDLGYRHPMGLVARVGMEQVSSQQPDAFARALDPVDTELSGLAGTIPAYTLLNASITYQAGPRLTLFLSGHNLADRRYLATRVDGMAAGRGRQVFGGVKYAL